MISLNFGEMPSRDQFNAKVPDEPFNMTIRNPELWANIADIINRGIDSHLEAVFCDADPATGEIVLHDRDSVWTFIRRCAESDVGDNDDSSAISFASSMMYVLGFEWV